MSAGDVLIGTRVGNYEVNALIGSGGMGDVYKATHVVIGAKVAIKVLRATTDSDADAVERFMREAKAVNRISHDRVIKITDAGHLPDRRPYLIMEWLDGKSLHDKLKPGEPMSTSEACAILIDVLDVVAAAHEADIVHRDLKPANIFITASGRTVVLDFGIARLLETNVGKGLTRVGAVIGTPSYMAPEQLLGQVIGPETDVYALGITLYQLVTGVRPFQGGSSREELREQLEDLPMAPTMWAPDLLPSVEAVIMKALAKKPEERYRNAAEMRDALRAALVTNDLPAQSAPPAVPVPVLPPDAPTLAAPAAAPPPTDAPAPRSRTALFVGAAVALAAVVGVVVWTQRGSSTTAPPPPPPPAPAPKEAAAPPPPAPPVEHGIITTGGEVLAEEPAHQGLAIYRGIPFAKAERWQPPRPPDAWPKARHSQLSTPCMQPTTPRVGDPDPSENCLFLDVYAPTKPGPLPVVVFFHGGNNIVGSNHQLDGSALAVNANAIVVIPNYRLNVFGWLALPGVATGNYGLLDQVAALTWVKTNVDKFGGDPAKVLLLGQSAGAVDACDLLVSRAGDLFSRLWLMSGSCFTQPLAYANAGGAVIAKALACDKATPAETAACMHALTATALLAAPGVSTPSFGVSYLPTIDGDLLQVPPAQYVRDGTTKQKMPVVVGSTADEYRGWVGRFVATPVTDEKSYMAALLATGLAKDTAAYEMTAYRPADHGGFSNAFAAYLSDWLAICPARRTANDLAAHENPVHRYVFEYVWSKDYGAGHGTDLSFAFGDASALALSPPLSKQIMQMIGSFAATGDPGVSEWPQYTRKDPRYFRLGAPKPEAMTDPAPHAALCDLFDMKAY